MTDRILATLRAKSADRFTPSVRARPEPRPTLRKRVPHVRRCPCPDCNRK